MNIFKLIVFTLYTIIGVALIAISKFLPDRYYLRAKHNYRILNSYKIIKLGRLLAFFSGGCWLIISYLFYNNINIIMVLWINIMIANLYNMISYRYIEKDNSQF